MTTFDGWAHDKHNSKYMLVAEAFVFWQTKSGKDSETMKDPNALSFPFLSSVLPRCRFLLAFSVVLVEAACCRVHMCTSPDRRLTSHTVSTAHLKRYCTTVAYITRPGVAVKAHNICRIIIHRVSTKRS